MAKDILPELIAKLKINKVEDCIKWLETIKIDQWQSITMLNEFLHQLSVSLAFINNQMAISKQILNKKKVTAYHSLLASSVSNETYFAPSLAKEYIAAKVDADQYNYDICERTSRTISHTIDAVRTAQSALKQELATMTYQNS